MSRGSSSQLLKSVIVEYDAFFGTSLRGGVAHSGHQPHRQEHAANSVHEEATTKPEPTSGWAKSHMWNDVRSFLHNLQHDASASPMQDRVQATLQGLPAHMVDKMMGKNPEKPPRQVSSAEESLELTKQFEKATGALPAQRNSAFAGISFAASKPKQDDKAAIRAKYMDKINRLKAQAAKKKTVASPGTSDMQNDSEDDTVTSKKGLTSWIVKEGTNEMLSYIALRGLSSAIIPPFSTVQENEFEDFMEKMSSEFNVWLSRDQLKELPNSKPLLDVSKKLEVEPHEVLVVSAHNEVVEAARRAGMNCCYCMPTPDAMPNHNAQYQLEQIKDLKFVIEDFNGISYRR